MNTSRPNKLMARLARVLSAVSSVTKVPTRTTAMVPAAPNGSLNFSGIIETPLEMVFRQSFLTKLNTGVSGTWKVRRRIEIPSHSRNGINQPSWRCVTRPEIHHLSRGQNFTECEYVYAICSRCEEAPDEEVNGPAILADESSVSIWRLNCVCRNARVLTTQLFGTNLVFGSPSIAARTHLEGTAIVDVLGIM